MRLAISLISFLMLVSSVVTASGAHPERDANKAVRFTEALEANPLRSDALAMRQWLMQWLTETPDFTVTFCDILGPIPKETVPYGPELLVQQVFGNVTYQIKNPGKTDQTSLQIAGVESVLRAYSAILVRDPKAHIPYFDTLLAKQQKNLLREYMAPIIAKGCTSGDGA